MLVPRGCKSKRCIGVYVLRSVIKLDLGEVRVSYTKKSTKTMWRKFLLDFAFKKSDYLQKLHVHISTGHRLLANRRRSHSFACSLFFLNPTVLLNISWILFILIIKSCMGKVSWQILKIWAVITKKKNSKMKVSSPPIYGKPIINRSTNKSCPSWICSTVSEGNLVV